MGHHREHQWREIVGIPMKSRGEGIPYGLPKSFLAKAGVDAEIRKKKKVSIQNDIKHELDQLEINSVSSSFGGPAIAGRAPSFSIDSAFTTIVEKILEYPDSELSQKFDLLSNVTTGPQRKATLKAMIRFAFIIELTNLSITSTKMKTRWHPGRIMKTRPDSFANFEGSFSPGDDERSSSFTTCYQVFIKCFDLLLGSEDHFNIQKLLSKTANRSFAYESVFGYVDYNLDPVHVPENIKLLNTDDISWLISVRPTMQTLLSQKNNNKISTKSYKTDRAQTGEVQTNRAKRWECLTMDYQHATVEECWSVERKLLEGLIGFNNFPEETKNSLIESELIDENIEPTKCPITLFELDFEDFQSEAVHGESRFQVGHLDPLKLNGGHKGENIAWISDDGNRIQGSLSLDDTITLIQRIAANHE